MAFCTDCGQELSDGAKFCANCGKAVNNNSTTQRKTVYDGELHKCPNCGEVLESFVVNCPTCGHEFRGATATGSVQEFAAKLDEIERTRPLQNSSIKKFFSNATGPDEIAQRKVSLIRSFAIPNTKEDLLEFLVLSSSNINLQRYNDFDSLSESEEAVSDAWEAKFEQAYQKASIVLGHATEFDRIQRLYDKKKAEVNRAKRKRILFWVLCPATILIVVFGLLFLANLFL